MTVHINTTVKFRISGPKMLKTVSLSGARELGANFSLAGGEALKQVPEGGFCCIKATPIDQRRDQVGNFVSGSKLIAFQDQLLTTPKDRKNNGAVCAYKNSSLN